MGQRSQIIIKTPEYFINEDNPNNELEQHLVFHNQWLYGYQFINTLNSILNNLEKLKAKHKKYFSEYTPNYKKMVLEAVECSNYEDVTNIKRTGRYDEGENDNNLIANNNKNWNDLFKYLDNNNGFIFIEILKNGDVRYDILNGLEDDEEIKRRTPKQYLELFYKKEDWKENETDLNLLISKMQKYSRIDYKKISFPKKTEKLFKVSIDLKVFAEDSSEAFNIASEKIYKKDKYRSLLKIEED